MQVAPLEINSNGSIETATAALDSASTLVLVFGKYDTAARREAFDAIRDVFPHSVLAGCSTSGQFWGSRLNDHGLVGVVARFDRTELAAASTRVCSSERSFDAGQELVRQLPDRRPAGVLLISDGVRVNGSELLRGLTSLLPEGVPVSGGLASDDAAFAETWVLAGKELGSGLLVAIAFYGEDIRLDYGSRGGWAPFGPERTVTRSVGNVLYELDGRPALELYRDYLGDYASALPGSALLFPLSVHSTDGHTKLVRTILAIDEAEQSMTFAGDVPEGAQAQLMRASADMLVDGAISAAEQCLVDRQVRMDAPALALGISCLGRRLVLGERVEDELEAVTDLLGPATQLVGFYSNGEISTTNGFCDLHNQTMTVTLIGEV